MKERERERERERESKRDRGERCMRSLFCRREKFVSDIMKKILTPLFSLLLTLVPHGTPK